MRRTHLLLVTAAFLLPLAGCQSAPRVRPVKMGDVDTGTTSVEAVRRQLKGTWELVTLDLVADGRKTPLTANGRLQYDEFGNMSMKGTVTGTEQIDEGLLNITGQVAIDPVAHTIRFRAIDANTPDERRIDPKLDAAHVRYYEFTPAGLTTSLKNANGATRAVATWKKVD
jgi:hypothetical protein